MGTVAFDTAVVSRKLGSRLSGGDLLARLFSLPHPETLDLIREQPLRKTQLLQQALVWLVKETDSSLPIAFTKFADNFGSLLSVYLTFLIGFVT